MPPFSRWLPCFYLLCDHAVNLISYCVYYIYCFFIAITFFFKQYFPSVFMLPQTIVFFNHTCKIGIIIHQMVTVTPDALVHGCSANSNPDARHCRKKTAQTVRQNSLRRFFFINSYQRADDASAKVLLYLFRRPVFHTLKN